MDDRYIRSGTTHAYNMDRTPGGTPGEGRDYGRDYTYSSARDYAAVGRYGPDYREDHDWARERSGRESRYDPSREYGGGSAFGYGEGYRSEPSEYRGSYWPDGHRTTDYDRTGWRREGRSFSRRGARRGDDDRGFFERAGDEVRSWFGDEEAERRRAEDERRWQANHPDAHYSNWRRSRIDELDRDYDEYRRENATRFENEFNSWRTERQGQRDAISRVNAHMEVVGADGEHLGTVDKVRGDRIVLTRSDPDAGGHHHSIPSRWIRSVDDKVTLTKTAEEARNHWRDEERGALGWDREEESGRTNLNRAFPGTY